MSNLDLVKKFNSIELSSLLYDEKIKNLDNKKILSYLLKLNYKKTKQIHPNVLRFLKAVYKTNFKFQNSSDIFSIKDKEIDKEIEISYQIKMEYNIINLFEKLCSEDEDKYLYNWFFLEKNGIIFSKNILVEEIFKHHIRYSRCDLVFTLENFEKFCIEINEKHHEPNPEKDKDWTRATLITGGKNNDNIIRIFHLKEIKFLNDCSKIEIFLNKLLIPALKESVLLNDEKNFIIIKSCEIIGYNFKDIIEIIYDAQINEEIYSVPFDILNQSICCDSVNKLNKQSFIIYINKNEEDDDDIEVDNEFIEDDKDNNGSVNGDSAIDLESDEESEKEDAIDLESDEESEKEDAIDLDSGEKDKDNKNLIDNKYYKYKNKELYLNFDGIIEYMVFAKGSRNKKIRDRSTTFLKRITSGFFKLAKENHRLLLEYNKNNNKIWGIDLEDYNDLNI